MTVNINNQPMAGRSLFPKYVKDTIVLVSIIISIVSAAKNPGKEVDSFRKDPSLTGYISSASFHDEVSRSRMECAGKCGLLSQCRGFFFVDKNRCFFVDNLTPTSLALVPKTNSVFYIKSKQLCL